MGSKPYKVQVTIVMMVVLCVVSDMMKVYRENKWKYIVSDELLPGDLVSIGEYCSGIYSRANW